MRKLKIGFWLRLSKKGFRPRLSKYGFRLRSFVKKSKLKALHKIFSSRGKRILDSNVQTLDVATKKESETKIPHKASPSREKRIQNPDVTTKKESEIKAIHEVSLSGEKRNLDSNVQSPNVAIKKESETKIPHEVSSSGEKRILDSNVQNPDVATKNESETGEDDDSSLLSCMCNMSLSEYKVPGPIPDFNIIFLDEASATNFFGGVTPIGCKYWCNLEK